MSSIGTVGMISISAIIKILVKQIIDQLSEGVAQMMLMVIKYKEQNASIPDTLPQAVAGVVKACETLVVI